ncbi:MAG: ethanolamine utilization protein EutJ [Anaerolineales bacterium]|nr:ethanolamine utilization protein EutJ [Anaerolineales bacterium]
MQEVARFLEQASQVITRLEDPQPPPREEPYQGDYYVGVDLGTAYVTVVVLDQDLQPLAGVYTFAQVARDGLVVDYVGAVDLVRRMKARLETLLGRELTHAASGYPPGVSQAEVRSTANVVEAAGFRCTTLTDEPTAANAIIGLQNGAIVDVGGGTTGIAVLRDGQVVYTADEPTGGTHFSLVIAGAHDISFEEAEQKKVQPDNQQILFPLVKPVIEKVAAITLRHTRDYDIPSIVMVGGTGAFYRTEEIITAYTGIPAYVPPHPALPTPLGIAYYDQP